MVTCFHPFLKRLTADCRGVSSMEYAVLAVGILTTFAVGITTLSGDIQNYYGVVKTTFLTAVGG